MNRLLRRSPGWLLLAALAVTCLWNLRPLRSTPEPVTPLSTASTVATTPTPDAPSPADAEAGWNRWRSQLPATKPAIEDVTEWPANRAEAFDKFRAWQAQHRAVADKVAVEAEGVALAKTRRAAMAKWIELDPEFALAQAVGPDARRELPAAVRAELERWVEGKGGYEVLVRCGPNVKVADQLARTVRVDGEEFRAFVYGRRLGQKTRYDLPIHAVAVDGKLALHVSPVRQLEAGEVRERGLNPGAIHLHTGDGVMAAAHAQDAFAVETKLLQREAGRGPYPAAGLKAGELPAGLPPGTMAFPPSPGWTLGQKRILIIRVDFSDLPGGPFDRNSGQVITTNAMATVMAQTDQFYRDNSQNQMSIQTTYVPVVLRMPQTKAVYGGLDPMAGLRQDALAAARTYDQQNGNTGQFNPDQYDFDISVFSDVAGFGFGGLAFVGAKGQLVHAEFSLRILGHELGHNFGLQHANRWDVTGSDPIDPAGTHNEYGDDYDMMGLNFINKAIHFNEWYKAYLGWLSSANWRTAPTSGVYRVFRHDHINASGIRGITAGQQSDRAYWLGYRRELNTQTFNNSAATNFLANGVEIRWGMQPPGLANNMTLGSRLLNLTPATANFTRHPLPIGQTFTDPAFSLSITPTGVGGTAPNEYIDLNVTYSIPPVSITQSPQSQTVFAGTNVTFSVTVTGTGPITYQWTFNGVNIPGATNTTLTLNNVTTNQSGAYLVQVTNPGGTINSQTATLTVNAIPLPPSITQQPVSLGVLTGSNVTFSVTATGDAPLVYRWFFNGTNAIAAGTNASLLLPNVGTNDAGNYHVVITNVVGSATSSVATLTVGRLTLPITWAAPTNVTYGTALGAVQLNATTTVPGTMTYTPPAGTVLSVGTNVLSVVFTPSDAVNYTTNSAVVSLVVTRAPLSVAADTKGRIYGQANPPLTITYTGFVNGETPSVLTSLPTLSTTATPASPPGLYPITISGATAANYAVTHVDGILAVTALAPVITAQPASTTNTVGTSALFMVGAGGFPAPTYQWFFKGGAIFDATNAALAVAVQSTNQAGSYQVVVTNVAGSLTSSVAVLTVERLVAATTWPTPTAVTYGTPLGAGQLNASPTVAGTFAYSPAAGTLLPVGTHTLTNVFTPTDASKYLASTGTVSLVVNSAPLIARADDKSRVFGQSNPALTVTYIGFVNSETAAVLTTPAVAATVADINSLPGTYAITASGATAANYTLTHSNGTLTVTVNQPPSANFATNNLVVLEDSGARTAIGFAVLSAGPAGDAGQSVTNVSVSNDNSALFAVAPALTGGTLTFTPAANANGTATVTVILQDDGGTAGGGVDLGTNTFSITVAAANDAPSFTIPSAVGPLLENNGASSSNAFATVISAGPADEASQAVTFSVTNDNSALFSAQPAINTSGTLTFTPAVNANGTATVTVVAQDNGGTANGGTNGSAPQTFTITVTAVNQAPSVAFATNNVIVLANSGPATNSGFAVFTAGPTNESGQTLLGYTLSNTSNTLFSAQPAIDNAGTLTFTPAPSAFGTATVTVVVQDNGGTANGGVDLGTNTFTITVSRLLPVLTWSPPAAITYGTALGASQLNASAGVVPGTFAYNPAAGTVLPAGTNLLTTLFTPTDTGAYENNSAVVTQVVNRAALTVTADNQSRAFGQANPVLTVSYSGFVNAESATVLTNPPVAATVADLNSLPGTYPITVSGAAGTNYTVAHVAGLLTVTAVPPALVSGPSNLTVLAGSNVTFTAVALGAPAPVFQWYFNSTNVLAGATNASLLVSNAQPVNAGGYSVVAANLGGSATSTVATLTVLVPPAISVQPQGLLVLPGSNVVFGVSASGTLPLTYQWYFNATNLLTGATNSLLSVTNAQAGVAGNYAVVVQNAGGTLVSSNALLTLGSVPSISQQPQDLTAPNGSLASLSVVAGGTAPLSYQWFKNTVSILDATNAVLAFPNVQVANAGTYAVVVSNVFGLLSSSNAVLQVVAPVAPTITNQPQNRIALAGSSATFSVGATGIPAPAYQWLKNSMAVPGATGASLLLTNLTVADAGNYSVQIFNSAGATNSILVSLEVQVPPAITVPPQGVLTNLGNNAVFNVAATGQPAPAYQWYKDGLLIAPLASGFNGQTTSNLTVLAVQPAQVGSYQVVVTNAAGSVTSAPVALSLVSAPVITSHPTNLSIIRTNFTAPPPALFSVVATGVPPLTYQWRFDGNNLPGATNDSLTWTNFARSNAGLFSVSVSNPGGTTLSSNALLQIRLSQNLAVPVRVGGGFRVAFGDMDGSGMVASNISRFEVQITTNLVDWVTAPNSLGILNGQFILDDSGAATFPRRYYRVIER